MRFRQLVPVLLFAAACAGPSGPTGPEGPEGQPGSQGPQGSVGPKGDQGDAGVEGPAGPLSSPPRIESVSPEWGSNKTEVTLTGQSFSATPDQNRVTFDGVEATMVSATSTQLVVRPGAPVAYPRPVAISVEVAKQVSNAVAFWLVPSGTPRAEPAALPTSPTAGVLVGADLYLAAGGFSSSAGLYRVESSGRTTRVVRAASLSFVPQGGGPSQLFDVPLALATDGTEVYFTSAFGSVRRYKPSTGAVSEVLGPQQGGGGPNWPPLSGIARGPTGFLYVVDRNLGGGQGGLLRLSPTGQLTAITDPALAGAFGVAADGTDVFVSIEGAGTVAKLADASGTYSVTGAFATGAVSPQGIAISGGKVIVSSDDGRLRSADRATGGAMAVHLDANGYTYQARGLHAPANGDLFLAQPDSSAVRKITSLGNAATIVSAGIRIAFGTLRMNGRWYFAGVGGALFSGGPAAGDGTILELAQDGSSRVLAVGDLPIGLAQTPSSRLAVSDCLGRKIYVLDPSNGTSSDLLTSADGLTCPAGLAYNTAGDLFYVNTVLGGPGVTTIGKRTSAGVNTLSFSTGLPPGTLHLARSGGKLLTLGLGPGGNFPIFSADEQTAGTATELVPGTAVSSGSALASSPTGEVYLLRFGGEILKLDPQSGTLSRFGTSLTQPIGGQGPQSMSFSIGFKPDGTLLTQDFGQGELIAVAP
ncbi:MAG: IPT/TIG domain-containing protein [Myxococcales bacterium]|nr:IPT/TIG domain-containing protein [Myxococcales bacterium]